MNKLPAFDAPADGTLPDEMTAAFLEYGVIILRGFVDADACAMLRDHTSGLVEAFQPGDVASIFSTKTNAQINDQYFIESGGAIRYFFEEDAFDDEGVLRHEKANSINKMGHAMHDLDPVFNEFSRTPKLGRTVRSIGFHDPLLIQSMYIFKPPAIGGEVMCHQDSTFLYTEPETCVGFWFAIDDADEENGCMRFIPGAHRGPLLALHGRGDDGKLETKTINAGEFNHANALAAPAQRGDLVIFHGRAPHMSGPNKSSRPRHAYTLHIAERSAIWPRENWLQRPANLPFRGF